MSAPLNDGAGVRAGSPFALLRVLEAQGELRSRAWVQAIDRAWRGGEPGVFFAAPFFEERADFGALVAHAVGRGLDTGWVSDGARLADAQYTERLVDRARLRRVHLRSRGACAEQVEVARVALEERGVKVVVTRELWAHSSEGLGATVAEDPRVIWTWIPDATDGLDPEATLTAIRSEGAHLESKLVGFPSCISAHDERLRRIFDEAQAYDGLGWLEAERVLPPACAGCARDMDCLGVPASWFRARGDHELKPFPPADVARPWAPIPAGDVSAFRPTERPRLDVAPRYPDTALITLMVAGCDLSCIFCDTPQEGMDIQFSTRESVRASLAAMSSRCSSVLFTGGEPSRLSWLTQIFQDAKSLGYEFIQMQSHAGAAADPAVADAWIAAGLSAIDVPIYGPDPQTHQEITRTPGSFERTLSGLKNLRERGAKSVIHTTLFKSNLPRLEGLLRLIEELKPDGAYLQTTGEVGAPGTYAQVAPSPEEVGVAMLDAFSAVTPQTPIQISDLTPCLVSGLEEHVLSWRRGASDLPRPVVLPYSEWLMVFSGGRTKGHHAVCEGCALKASCDGLPLESLSRFRGVGLVPR